MKRNPYPSPPVRPGPGGRSTIPATLVLIVLIGTIQAQEQVAVEGQRGAPRGRGAEALPRPAIEAQEGETVREPAAPRFVVYRGSDAEVVTRSKGYDAEPVPPSGKKLQDLHLDLRISYDGCPPYIREEKAYNPPIDIEPLKDCPPVRGLKNLIQNELFRQLRSRLKREWRQQFAASNMGYDSYMDRLIDINQIGRYVESRDQVTQEYYLFRARENVFRRYHEGEDEIPVLKLGPLMVLDSGSLSFDASLLTRLFAQDQEEKSLELGPRLEDARRPLFSGKSFRVHTKFRLSIDPFRALTSGDAMDTFRSYGAVVDISWLTDILRRERFVTEFETQYSGDGELAFFFNLVMKSW